MWQIDFNRQGRLIKALTVTVDKNIFCPLNFPLQKMINAFNAGNFNL